MEEGTDEQEEVMPRPVVKWEWNIGNIITLFVIAAGMIAGYTRLESSATANTNTITRLEIKDENLQKQIDTLRDTLNTRDVLVTGKLTRIETIVERIEKKQGP